MLFEQSAAAMAIADRSGRYLQVNRAFCEFLGRPCRELLELSHTDVVHPDELEEVRTIIQAGASRDAVRRFVRKDGAVVWGHVSAIVIEPQQGEPYWVGVIQDFTARVKAEQVLRESEERFRVIANDNPAYLWMTSTRYPNVTFINAALAAFLGVDQTEMARSKWAECVHPEDWEPVLRNFQERLGRGLDVSVEFRMRRSDGTYRMISSVAHPRRSPSGDSLGATGVLTDITERRIAEESLRNARDALARELAERSRAEQEVRRLNERLIRAHEDERSRIARELHDDLSQRIASISTQLSTVKRDIRSENPVLQEKVDRVHNGLSEVAKLVRNISHQLHPAVLEYVGLTAALRGQCAEFAAVSGIEVEFHADDAFKDLSSEVALCLFRIAQEALQNVAKHASVQSAAISLVRDAGGVVLTVTDEGRGFDSERLVGRFAGLGLISMRERLAAVHGHLDVISRVDHGTRITASVPLGTAATRNRGA